MCRTIRFGGILFGGFPMSKRPVQPQQPAGLIDSIQSEVAGEASPLLEFLINNARPIVACVLLFIIAIVGFGAYSHYSGKANKEAQDEFGRLAIIQDPQKRLAALEAYLSKAPEATRPAALAALAQTAFAAEQPQKAYDAWAEIAKLNPDLRVPAAHGMARALEEQGKSKEALAVYEGIVNGLPKPETLSVNSRIVWLAESVGDYKRAVVAGDAILALPDLDPADAKVWLLKVAELKRKAAQPQ